MFVLLLLPGETTSWLSLSTGEGADAGPVRQEDAFLGDLVEDVFEEVEKILRGKRPRRHCCDERRRAWPW